MRINFGNIKIKRKINFENVKLGVKKVYPELENLKVIPSVIEQKFKSKKYGYGEVTVKAIDIKLQEKSATPTEEIQEIVADEGYTALSKVIVEKISDEYIKPLFSDYARMYVKNLIIPERNYKYTEFGIYVLLFNGKRKNSF